VPEATPVIRFDHNQIVAFAIDGHDIDASFVWHVSGQDV